MQLSHGTGTLSKPAWIHSSIKALVPAAKMKLALFGGLLPYAVPYQTSNYKGITQKGLIDDQNHTKLKSAK